MFGLNGDISDMYISDCMLNDSEEDYYQDFDDPEEEDQEMPEDSW